MRIQHKLVECIPEKIERGVLYVSLTHTTAIHLCCCGCGREVVTPLEKNGWRVQFDGQTVSLYPSIGNWRFECQSHYWIKNSEIRWAEKWSRQKIAAVRNQDPRSEADASLIGPIGHSPKVEIAQLQEPAFSTSLWLRLRKFLP